MLISKKHERNQFKSDNSPIEKVGNCSPKFSGIMKRKRFKQNPDSLNDIACSEVNNEHKSDIPSDKMQSSNLGNKFDGKTEETQYEWVSETQKII